MANGPLETRHRSRAEHRCIRERLSGIEHRARVVSGQESPTAREARKLERELETLRDQVECHLRWEEELLPDLLREADAWGAERAARVRSAHAELREVLAFCRGSCAASESRVVLARRARELARLVRGSLRDEERDAVRPDVLREDVIGIDVVTS